MDIQKKPTLAEKQAFWAEQLPNFESTYWLQSHFEFVVFDMNQGNYVIKDGLSSDFEDDALEIWHRVNTGWAMWKKAINFSCKEAAKAQAVPECTWSHDSGEDMYGTWHTKCGNAFVLNEDGPTENQMNYCCYCGGKLIEAKEQSNDSN